MKTCTKCGETKPAEGFSRTKRNRDGLSSWCKRCLRENTRRYREDPGYRVKEQLRNGARRARKHGRAVEPVTLADLESAWGPVNGWTCYICGRPGAVSLDHVHPIERGGGHTRDNLAPTHWEPCNNAKGRRPLGSWLVERNQAGALGFAQTVAVLFRARAAR